MKTKATVILAVMMTFIYSNISAAVTPRALEEVIYDPEDSIRIEILLKQGIAQPKGTNLQIFFAQQFLGLPYVARTLEANYIQSPQTAYEQLIINTRELDCTTFVETVSNLTITALQGKTTFADYCQNLIRMRYQKGIINGYASRNHYYSTAIDNMQRLGIAKELKPTDCPRVKARRYQHINYMTTHTQQYPALAAPGGDKHLPAIRKAEEIISRQQTYIPLSELGKSQEELSCIEDGDILALVTDKPGLDVAHVVIAQWGKDGMLHFIHASSLRHKVVEEPLTLLQYQQQQKQLGVRVVKLLIVESQISGKKHSHKSDALERIKNQQYSNPLPTQNPI
ncbi:MAG: DUF1460 domain-containing protein [Bacteroidaceae bacterium]|nr:DUF1460 domain-containing protein [Bacteroidaceae bacterium]